MDRYYVITKLQGVKLKFENYQPPFGFIYNASGIIVSGNATVISVADVPDLPTEYETFSEFTTYLQTVLWLNADELNNYNAILNNVVKDLAHCNHGTYLTGHSNMQFVAFDFIEGLSELK